MEYRRLGKSGLQLSEISLGSWLTFGKKISDDTAEELMIAAYDNGINFFDNAEIYARGKSETVMGNILKKLQWSRDTYVVSSKVFWGGDKPNQTGLSRKHVMDGCHAALKRFQLDYLDLFFCHRADPNTPMEETVWAMNDLIRQGKILYWGTSEWTAQEIMEAFMVARQHNLIPPTMEQPQYNMFYRQRFEVEHARIFETMQYGSTTWSPLASGLLSGKYNNGIPEDSRLGMEGLDWLKDKTLSDNRIEKVRKLSALASDIGTTMPRLAIAWVLKNKNVSTVITGASKVEHLLDNIAASGVVSLITEDVNEKIEKILGNKQVPYVW